MSDIENDLDNKWDQSLPKIVDIHDDDLMAYGIALQISDWEAIDIANPTEYLCVDTVEYSGETRDEFE